MRKLTVLTILLSAPAEARFGARIDAVLEGRPHRRVHLDAAPDASGDFGVDVGFLTRDVTGLSGKFKPSEALAHFFHILAHSRSLAWVQTHSAGTDRPVWDPIRARGIAITTGAGAMSGTVAISAVGGLVALARRFPELMDAQRRHAWEPMQEDNAPRDLAGQSALVVGLGAIGGEIARLLRAFGLRVTGVRLSGAAHPHCDATIGFDALDAHLPKADWLVLACPLTELTRGLVDAAALARLPRGAHLVNVARGEVVAEDALIAALQSGHVAGAWLDVFAYEPLNSASPLWDLPRVMVSPHTSSRAAGNYDRVGAIFLDNLARWRDGRPLANDTRDTIK